MTKTLQTDDR